MTMTGALTLPSPAAIMGLIGTATMVVLVEEGMAAHQSVTMEAPGRYKVTMVMAQ